LQPNSPERAQALDASQNAAYSVEQPVQDQSLLPPQPPALSDTTLPAATSQAQLGIQMLASDGPGVRISNIMPGSAAEAAGLQVGDYVLAVGNQTVELPVEVTNIIRSHKVGDAVQIRIWRDRADQLITANLQELRPTRTQISTTVNRPIYTEDPVAYENNVVGGYAPTAVYRQYYYPGYRQNYYPGNFSGYGYAPYGYRYNWGAPYRGSYYGTPRFGYWNSPWGEGVNVGGFRFGWR
jgi:hypothetical protein